ncbi:MAG: SH3 domain-containing protein [Anaerolineales bacterium]
MYLVGGPFCFDNAVWWAVSHPDFPSHFTRTNGRLVQISGYVVEIDSENNHYLEKQSCGDLPTRLSSNTWARVVHSTGRKNVREQPGFSGTIKTTIPEGARIRVTGDSRCVDDNRWWPIETTDGIEGWMTETQDGIYLLEPAPK